MPRKAPPLSGEGDGGDAEAADAEEAQRHERVLGARLDDDERGEQDDRGAERAPSTSAEPQPDGSERITPPTSANRPAVPRTAPAMSKLESA